MGDVTELLQQATGGDQNAWDEVYPQIEPELRKLAKHWIRRKCANEQVHTTDVIDRAFVNLMKTRPKRGWDHRGAFYVFASRNILRIVIALLRNSSRQPGNLPDGEDVDEIPAPVKELTVNTLLTLQQALVDLEKDLSETHRKVVELRFFGGCTLDEIAEQLSIDRFKAFRISRVALEHLRERLRPSFPDLVQPRITQTETRNVP